MATLIQFKGSVAGIKLPIDKLVFHIGRGTENDISIDDELVSKRHAVIEAVANGESKDVYNYYIKDLESTNSTFVNDQKIKLHKLENEDIIAIGLNNFQFVDDANDDLDETTKIRKTWIPGVYFANSKKKKNTRKKSTKK